MSRTHCNPNEIREVQNAYEAYDMMLLLDPSSVNDLLKAHQCMMQGLIPENGRFRSRGVGIFDGERLIHMAPPARFVPAQIQALFAWYADSEMHPLIKSAVFHYEFEFIHPFADGNGRVGRMWHSMLLGAWKELFYWLPAEELIHARQKAYYAALHQSDTESDSSAFVYDRGHSRYIRAGYCCWGYEMTGNNYIKLLKKIKNQH